MNQLKTVLLLGILSAILVGVGGALGSGPLGVSIVLAVVMNVGAYFFSDRIVLAMHRAQEISPAESPQLHRMVAELAARAGIPMPRLYLIPEAQPNAFATGRNPEHAVVAVTSGILDVLEPRELRGVLAHELAHVKNRDILVSSIAATVAAAITYVAHAVGFLGMASSDDDGPSPAQSLLLALVAPLAATLIQLGISRSREYGADATGAEISGDPEALARALEKLDQAAHAIPAPVQPGTASLFIVNPFSGTEGVLTLFSTHPSMRERIRRLRAMQRSSGGWQMGTRDATLHAG
ncbi:MAG TPA: zinc metalloprotease HtpX [Myxococcaceae bacterium]|nr:zinc metalloprotease HtpX [Myxococcaceae bacterium]